MGGAVRPAMLRHALVAASLASLFFAAGCAPGDSSDWSDDPADTAQDEALSTHSVTKISTISYAPNSFVIGNAYPGWHDAVQGNAQFSQGPGNPNGASYRWGFLYGENFDACGWINDDTAKPTGMTSSGSKCGAPQEINTPYFLAHFTNGMHNQLAGDGSITHMHYAGSGCSNKNGYGNVEPWRVPATPANPMGAIPDGTELRWRYVSKDGHWVLVRQPGATAPDRPNWFFVHRGCVSLANAN
jgi:hypothetical protein